jgi:hypothetical protein
MNHYILDPHGTPVIEPDLETWARWFESAATLVCYSVVGESAIKTRFLGISWAEDNPHLWETKVLGGTCDAITDRCPGTREQAEAMHARMVARVQNQNPKPA